MSYSEGWRDTYDHWKTTNPDDNELGPDPAEEDDMPEEVYLGDGLYASFDGYMITLRAPREGGDHHVGLEPEVLDAFERFVAAIRARRAAAR